MGKEIETPFGTLDSELYICEWTIPDGYQAEIKDNKVIVKKTMGEEERIRNWIIGVLKALDKDSRIHINLNPEILPLAIAWLEKQEEHVKFLEAIQVGGQVTRNQDGMIVNLSQLDRIAKAENPFN